MLFLGAGASHPFGIPTTYKLAGEVANSLPEGKSEWKEELSKIRFQTIEMHKNFDIEILLNLLISKSGSIASKYYESSDFISDIKVSLSKPQILELVNEIEKQIYKRCLKFDRRKAINTYKELYSSLHENAYGGRAKFDKNYMERLDNFKITKRVITTNYDPIFETFIRTTQKKYSDGFTMDDLGDITFKKDWNERQDDRIQLVKLHGSINYYLKDDKRIVKYDIPTDSPEMDIFGQRIIERMMILPFGHKYSSQSPYIDLLNQFRTYLDDEQLLIVIGYSFRDLAVNNALIDRAAKITSGDSITNFKIVLVDERVKDVINNNVPRELQKVFTTVNTSFEGIQTSNKVINAIKDRQCGDGLR